MSFWLTVDIAKTLLLARLKQSVIAAVGVTFGIGMFISMMGFMSGLNQLLDNLILNRTPHVLLYNEIKINKDQPIRLSKEFGWDFNIIHSVKPKGAGLEIKNSLAILNSLKNDPYVLGVAPRASAQVFYKAGSLDINGTIFGVDVEAEQKLFAFNDYIIQGEAGDLQKRGNSIILGKGIAEKLLVEIGDMVQVSTANGRQISLKVVGVFQLGLAEVDAIQSYASIETVQNVLGKSSNYMTEIQIKLHDLDKAPDLAKQYNNIYHTDTRDIISANTQFETGSSIRNMITYAVSITLLIVAGFGIYNILNMMIYEKMDSIAILKATGFAGRDVRNIFLSLSLIIGITGGLAGLLFGFIGSWLIDQAPFETSSLPTIKTMPVVYNIWYYITGITFSVVTTFLAGFFPARRASKVDPVEIIRGK